MYRPLDQVSLPVYSASLSSIKGWYFHVEKHQHERQYLWRRSLTNIINTHKYGTASVQVLSSWLMNSLFNFMSPVSALGLGFSIGLQFDGHFSWPYFVGPLSVTATDNVRLNTPTATCSRQWLQTCQPPLSRKSRGPARRAVLGENPIKLISLAQFPNSMCIRAKRARYVSGAVTFVLVEICSIFSIFKSKYFWPTAVCWLPGQDHENRQRNGKTKNDGILPIILPTVRVRTVGSLSLCYVLTSQIIPD